MRINFLTPILFLFPILIISCTKKESSPCPDDIICTEVFVSITLKVEHISNKAIDTQKTITEIEGSSKIITNNDVDTFLGTYVILDDLSIDELVPSGTRVSFRGFGSGDKLLWDEKYVIGHDCCHVVMLEGKEKIIID